MLALTLFNLILTFQDTQCINHNHFTPADSLHYYLPISDFNEILGTLSSILLLLNLCAALITARQLEVNFFMFVMISVINS